jgi:hypothetical protein
MIGGDTRTRSPGVDRDLHPGWHRCGTNASVFSDKIDDTPASVTLLKVREFEGRNFRSTKSAAKKNREDGTIAQAVNLRDIRRAHKASLIDLYREDVTSHGC